MQSSPRNRSLMSAALAALFVAGPFAASAYDYPTVQDEMTFLAGEHDGIEVYLGLKTAGRLQSLSHRDAFMFPAPTEDDPSPAARRIGSPDPGFQTAWGSMDFLARFGEFIDVYWEFFISSKPHASSMQGSQGFMLIRGLPEGHLAALFDFVDVKAGQFEVNFGDHIYRRSDNARVLRNPLIGNYVIDPRTTGIGMEIMTKPGLVNALVGVTSGTESGDFREGRGTAVHGKLWVVPTENARIAASAYYVDHSDNPVGGPGGGSQDNLFRTSRSGGPYGGILDDGNAPGQVFVGRGQKVQAYQLDASFRLGDLDLYGHAGWTEDGDTNGSAPGSPKESWVYYAAEAVYDINSRIYAAVRYSAAQADRFRDAGSDGRVDRIQAGVGYWVTDHILAKLEYVHQTYRRFNDGDVVSGVDAGRDPSFHGVIAEVGFAF